MTILMALTLVPTWLLGGVFATTAKADNTVELSGVAMATTVKDKKDKNTFGDSFGGDYDCKNGFVIDKGVIHKNSAKDIKEGSTTIFKGKKDSNGEIDSVCLQVNASNAIRYTVPEGNTATISVIAGTSGGKTGEKRNVVIKKVLGENNENEVTKGKDMTKGGSSDVNADGTAFSKTVSSKMEAGTYAIYGSNTSCCNGESGALYGEP